ncbi:MAG TPA: hypothetical protein VGK59_11120 [Ohtaekwangia sp.]
MKTYPFFVILLCTSIMTLAQQHLKFINAEAGSEVVFNNVPDHKYIWGQQASDGTEQDLAGYVFSRYFGVALELKSDREVTFATGLRFKQMDVTLGTNPILFGPAYYYVITNQTETSAEFLRVRDITQTTNYLGVTGDVRWYPFTRHRFTFYFKGGLEIDYRLRTKTEVTFENSDMNPYAGEVEGLIKDPADLTGVLHFNAGVEIGKKFLFRLEMGPSIFLNQNTSGLVKTIAGFDFGLSVQLPLNRSHEN